MTDRRLEHEPVTQDEIRHFLNLWAAHRNVAHDPDRDGTRRKSGIMGDVFRYTNCEDELRMFVDTDASDYPLRANRSLSIDEPVRVVILPNKTISDDNYEPSTLLSECLHALNELHWRSHHSDTAPFKGGKDIGNVICIRISDERDAAFDDPAVRWLLDNGDIIADVRDMVLDDDDLTMKGGQVCKTGQIAPSDNAQLIRYICYKRFNEDRMHFLYKKRMHMLSGMNALIENMCNPMASDTILDEVGCMLHYQEPMRENKPALICAVDATINARPYPIDIDKADIIIDDTDIFNAVFAFHAAVNMLKSMEDASGMTFSLPEKLPERYSASELLAEFKAMIEHVLQYSGYRKRQAHLLSLSDAPKTKVQTFLSDMEMLPEQR